MEKESDIKDRKFEMKSIARKAKRLVKTVLGEDFFTRVDCKCNKVKFGSEYGGWDIVVGNIDANAIVYSFGVGEDVSFDIALIKRFNLVVHAFDPTPKSIEWVKKQGFSENFVMHEYGIAGYDGNVSFNPPENPDHVSHTILNRPATEEKSITVQVKRLGTIMKDLGHSRIDILKMDVEGAEYDVIDEINNSDIRPKQFLVEFHHRFPGIGIKRSKEAIDKIRNMGYLLFSVSSTGEEFCFIRRPH